VLKRDGVQVARLDSDVTFENVKQTILPFLTEEMLLKLKEEEDEVEKDGTSKDTETIKVSVKKNAVETFWTTHPSTTSESQHYTKSQIVRLYADFVIALRKAVPHAMLSINEEEKVEDHEINQDHLCVVESTKQTATTTLRRSSDLKSRIHQSSSLLIQMIPLSIFARRSSSPNNYALELEHVMYVTVMRELFKFTSCFLSMRNNIMGEKLTCPSDKHPMTRFVVSTPSCYTCDVCLSEQPVSSVMYVVLFVTGRKGGGLRISWFSLFCFTCTHTHTHTGTVVENAILMHAPDV